MLERLVAFALSQRLFVALGVLLLIGAGLVMLPSLPIDAFPDVSPIQVKVIMKAATGDETERRQRHVVGQRLVRTDLSEPHECGLRRPALYLCRNLRTLPSLCLLSFRQRHWRGRHGRGDRT
jgi:hypothetical protein